jgi:hypothetical protein
MEILFDLLHLSNDDVGRKKAVQSFLDGQDLQQAFCFKMGHLP